MPVFLPLALETLVTLIVGTVVVRATSDAYDRATAGRRADDKPGAKS